MHSTVFYKSKKENKELEVKIDLKPYKGLTDAKVKEAIISNPHLVIKDYFYILDKLKIKP